MKIKTTLLAFSIAILSSASTFASTPVKSKLMKTIHRQVTEIIGNNLDAVIQGEILVRVPFFINKNNEIVVVDVISKSDKLNSLIKNKLNHQKLELNEVKQQEIYILPVRVNKGQ